MPMPRNIKVLECVNPEPETGKPSIPKEKESTESSRENCGKFKRV